MQVDLGYAGVRGHAIKYDYAWKCTYGMLECVLTHTTLELVCAGMRGHAIKYADTRERGPGYAVLFGQVQRHGALTYSRKLGHAGACGHATKYAYAW